MLRKIALFSVLAAIAIGCSAGDQEGISQGSSSSGSTPSVSAGGGGYSAMRGGAHVGAKRDSSTFVDASDGESVVGAQAGGMPETSRMRVADNTPPPRVQVRGATLSVRVEKLEDAEKKIQGFIKSSGGFEENLSSTDLASSDAALSISAKVPVNKLDEVVSEVEGLGTRLAKTVSMQDVTDQLTDWNQRLQALKGQQADLRKQGSTNVGFYDYQTQQQSIQSQINYAQQQRDLQSKTASMATLQLDVKQGAIPGAHQDPNWLAQAYGESSSSAGEAFRVVATGLLWMLFMSPFYMPFVAGGWLAYRLYKRKANLPSGGAKRATSVTTQTQATSL